MADKLTPQQEQAVYDRGGKLLVSAAAGSGKTKVLVDRLLSYLTDDRDPANLDAFLMITYTKAAASELRGKIAAKLTEQIALCPENKHLQKQMQRLFLTKISTVHGFCSDLLREYAYRLDIAADFRVADEHECREIRETVLEDLMDRAYEGAGESEDFRAFVDTQGVGRNDKLVPQIIETVFDNARCHLDPARWLEKALEDTDVSRTVDASQTLWGRYLMEDLADYLDCQMEILNQCAQSAESCPGFEKAAVVLRDAVYQMEILRRCESWDQVVAHKQIDFKRLTFPTSKNPDPELSQRIKAAWNLCKDGIRGKLKGFANSSQQVLEDLNQCGDAARGLVRLVRQFEKDYGAAKARRRCLDFSDLEQKTLDLLLGKSRSGPTAAALEIGRRYREIMVDEYQDSNEVQDAIFGALTLQRQNCFMVGDVKQSIYQFRLADPSIFLKKYNSYGPAETALPGQGRKVLLSHNFRSGPEVIEGVNQVFHSCMSPKVGGLHYTEAEQLREGIPHMPLPDAGVELHVIQTRENQYREEAQFVAEKIQTMLRQGTLVRGKEGLRPVTPEDIVILLRSPGSGGSYFQQALEQRGIRCASGGGTDLLKTQEIATLRALLQTIQNPRQDIPLLSTLASPVFGFTADDLAAFRSRQKKGSIYDALLLSDSPKARAFLETLGLLRREARKNSLTALLETCFTLTRMDSIYGAMPGGKGKEANLQSFFQLAADFEKGSRGDLDRFLYHLAAMEEKGLLTAEAANSGCVTIMSIHKSKGLEFPVVFLGNLSRRFNKENLKAPILCDKDLGLGLSAVDTANRVRYSSLSKRAIAVKQGAESLSEELRVVYVAMTRARDRLIMTYAEKNPQKLLQELALMCSFDGGRLSCREAQRPGEWVLLEALQHTEAGTLHALGARPAQTRMGQYPWKITLSDPPETEVGASAVSRMRPALPQGGEQELKEALSFRYSHIEATLAPSKQTATGRKGRVKDAEAAENTKPPRMADHRFRRPVFLEEKQADGRAYGSAMHAALQYLRFENCGSMESVKQEIRRLIQGKFITQEQGGLVNCPQIAAFFQTDIGRKLSSGTPCIREFKFSILDDGKHYGEGLEGEQVLLQGVVDCALIENDGITIVDFKTDRVNDSTVSTTAERYRPQVEVYGEALSRIYEKPIKRKLLYFFQLGRFAEIL